MKNYATCAQIVSLSFILRLKMFMRTLEMMLKKRFDTSNYEIERPLPTGKKNNWINEI